MITAWEPKDPALRSVYWREEILEVVLWLRGGGYDDLLDRDVLSEFLGVTALDATSHLRRLAAQGYLRRRPDLRFELTLMGEQEAERIVGGPRSVPLGIKGRCGPQCWCSISPVERARCETPDAS